MANATNATNATNSEDFDGMFNLGDSELSFPVKEEADGSIKEFEKEVQSLEAPKKESKEEIAKETTEEIDRDNADALALALGKNKELPKLMGDLKGIDPDYIIMSERILSQYKMLPSFCDSIYQEIKELKVADNETPTPHALMLALEKTQAAKERLGEIFLDVVKTHTFKKRAIDILKDSYGKFAQAKNAEARKGEAAFIVSDFEIDFAILDSIFRACLHILKILDDRQESLSRRITVWQTQIKTMDNNRGISPDFNYNKPFAISDEKLPSMFEDLSKDSTQKEKSSDDPDEIIIVK